MKTRPRIAVIDYGMGNLRSVAKALEKAGARVQVTDSPATVLAASGVVLPGVGAFGEAAKRLRRSGLFRAVEKVLARETPFLGICLGLQLLFEKSDEAPGLRGFGFFKGTVRRFRTRTLKVPHMGWNTLQLTRPTAPALSGIRPKDYFYFVHSYFPAPETTSVIAATTRYGETFCSAAASRNLLATQFHPEKSGRLGLRLLSNYVRQVNSCS